MTNNSAAPVVATAQGQVRGVRRTTVYDQDYYSFEKIPFAQPPLGELRFRAPQPPQPWEGVRDGSTASEKPMQKSFYTGQVEGTEDCLYLNVYAKTLDSEKPLPVLVWIYGGGFYMGEANRNLYGPDYFMDESVVLVTLNYRVCSLGFLSLADPALQVPGNAGLKDQVMALRWVKQNIARFNGDADNITVFGESAGGASTHFMTVTEQTRGLFHKAIPMSGCVLNGWAIVPPADHAFRLAKSHGYAGANVDRDVLEFLRGLEAAQLVDHNIMTDEDRRNGMLFPFGPTVEPYVGEDCVIPRAPLEMVRTAWSNEIPMMLGGTSFEGLLMYPRLKMAPGAPLALAADPERALPVDVRAQHSPAENRRLAEQLIRCHFGDEGPSEKTPFKYLDLLSYKVFWHGFHRTLQARLAYAPQAPTFLYRFDFDSPDFNLYRKKFCGSDPVRGVAHADDLSYLFYWTQSWKLPLDSPEYRTIRRMVGMWTSFARNSDPNCEQIKPAVWAPLQPGDPHRALNIGAEVEVVQLPEAQKLAVWDSMYAKETLY